MVDALGLGSNDYVVQVQVLFCVEKNICSFLISSNFCKMKYSNIRKYKIFPYAAVQKKGNIQWNPLAKLSYNRKRFFKNKSRFFSMEYGRSLSKRILWQIAVPEPNPFLQQNFIFNEEPCVPCTQDAKQKKMKRTQKKVHTKEYNLKFQSIFPKKKGFQAYPQKTKLISVYYRNTVLPNHPFSQTWVTFRSIFFGKMWVLNNPSLVPGVVRPVKSKKILLAKLRAFKGLTHLVGNSNQKVLVKFLNKLWNLSPKTATSLWSIASGLESLKTAVLIKSGFLLTIPAVFDNLSRGAIFINGEGPLGSSQKSLSFSYPGDILKMNNKLEKLFIYGPTTKKTETEKNVIYSIYLIKPFLWLSSFYNYGNVLDFFGKQKKLPSKHRYSKKRFVRKGLPKFNSFFNPQGIVKNIYK